MRRGIRRVRAEYRQRRLSWLAVAVVAGIAGHGRGYRPRRRCARTERRYPDFVEAGHRSDVLVSGKNSFGLVGSVDLDDVEKLPKVAATTRMNGEQVDGTDSARRGDRATLHVTRTRTAVCQTRRSPHQ